MSQEQKIYTLKQVEAGGKVLEVYRQLAVIIFLYTKDRWDKSV